MTENFNTLVFCLCVLSGASGVMLAMIASKARRVNERERRKRQRVKDHLKKQAASSRSPECESFSFR